MSIEYLTDIQFTPSLQEGTLVREINQRLHALNRSFVEVTRTFQILELLTTIKSFEVEYRNNVDIDVFTIGALDVYITAISLRSPGTTMDVTCGILHASGVPAGFTPITLDPALDPIPVTDTGTLYTPLADNQGGNAHMTENDIFQVQTSNGTVGSPLFITVKFDIIGLSEDPAVAAQQLASFAVPLPDAGPP